MKTPALAFSFVILFSSALFAQQPAPAAGARGGSGGMRGGPAVPAASGPMLDLANKLADAINKLDSAGLKAMLAPDCVYLDEDGHAPDVNRWVAALTSGNAKQFTISGTHSQLWDDAGWVSFNYAFNETYQGQPRNIKGTASIVVKKASNGDWLIELVHGALYQKIAGLTGR